MRAAITLWRYAGVGDTVTIPSVISTLLPSGQSDSSRNRTRSSQVRSGSWLTVSALMAVSSRCVTGPSMTNGTGGGPPIPFTRTKKSPDQAIRSSTTGEAVNSVPAGAMSYEPSVASRA